MKKIAAVVVSLLIVGSFIGCTANDRAKNYGGTMTVSLSPGEKLVVVTWKDDSLWYLTRPMRPGETPEVFTFREESSFGFLEGTVVIHEAPPPTSSSLEGVR